MKKKTTQRFIALFIASSFLIFEISSSAPPVYAYSVKDAPAVLLPNELGRIEGSFVGHGDKTVVFIQDAHDSLEAQENIAGIIQYFVNEKGVQTVFEEGYEGPVPTDKFFGFIQNPAVKEKVAYFWMDKLRLGGAEYAHINRRKDFKLIGADNIQLHLENIDWYRENARYQKDTEKDLKILLSEIEKLAHQRFPKELKDWMKLKKRYDEKKLGLLDYLKRTLAFARVKPGEYPFISLLVEAGRSPNPEVFEKIKAVNPRIFFDEINRLENRMAQSLLSEPKDRKIFHFYKALSLLERLNTIEVTSPEYEASQSVLKSFNTQDLAEFIAKTRKKSIVLSKRWESNIQNAVHFYEISRLRDQAIDSRLNQFLNESKEKVALLVFGGFHKERIQELLSQKGFSYLVVSPKITDVDSVHQKLYRNSMSQGLPNIHSIVPLNRAARLASAIEVASLSGKRGVNQLQTYNRILGEIILELIREQPHLASSRNLLHQAVVEHLSASRPEVRLIVYGQAENSETYDVEIGRFDRSPRDRGKSWHERYPKILVKTQLSSHGQLGILGQNGVASFTAHPNEEVEVYLEWSLVSKQYVILSLKLESETEPVAFNTVWVPDQEKRNQLLLASFYSSVGDRGRSWHELYPEIQIKTALDSGGVLSLLGQNGVAKFTTHPNERIDVFLTWSSLSKKYVITSVRFENEKELSPFKTVWVPTASGEYELLSSFYDSPSDRGKSWSKKYPNFLIKARLTPNGELSLLGQPNIVHFPIHPNENVEVFWQWSAASKKYVVTSLKLESEAETRPFRTVWVPDEQGKYELLYRSFHDSPQDKGKSWHDAHPMILIRTQLASDGGLYLFGEGVLARFNSHPNEPVEAQLAWSELSQSYLVHRVDFKTDLGRPVFFHFVEEREDNTVSGFQFPPEKVTQTFYAGRFGEYYLSQHSLVSEGNNVWAPWLPTSDLNLFLDRFQNKLYRFEEVNLQDPVYGVYRWRSGRPEFLGAWLKDRWIPEADLSSHMLSASTTDPQFIEMLQRKAVELWPRDEDKAQTALLAALEGLAQGVRDLDALVKRMYQAVVRFHYEGQKFPPTILDLDSFGESKKLKRPEVRLSVAEMGETLDDLNEKLNKAQETYKNLSLTGIANSGVSLGVTAAIFSVVTILRHFLIEPLTWFDVISSLPFFVFFWILFGLNPWKAVKESQTRLQSLLDQKKEIRKNILQLWREVPSAEPTKEQILKAYQYVPNLKARADEWDRVLWEYQRKGADLEAHHEKLIEALERFLLEVGGYVEGQKRERGWIRRIIAFENPELESIIDDFVNSELDSRAEVRITPSSENTFFTDERLKELQEGPWFIGKEALRWDAGDVIAKFVDPLPEAERIDPAWPLRMPDFLSSLVGIFEANQAAGVPTVIFDVGFQGVGKTSISQVQANLIMEDETLRKSGLKKVKVFEGDRSRYGVAPDDLVIDRLTVRQHRQKLKLKHPIYLRILKAYEKLLEDYEHAVTDPEKEIFEKQMGALEREIQIEILTDLRRLNEKLENLGLRPYGPDGEILTDIYHRFDLESENRFWHAVKHSSAGYRPYFDKNSRDRLRLYLSKDGKLQITFALRNKVKVRKKIRDGHLVAEITQEAIVDKKVWSRTIPEEGKEEAPEEEVEQGSDRSREAGVWKIVFKEGGRLLTEDEIRAKTEFFKMDFEIKRIQRPFGSKRGLRAGFDVRINGSSHEILVPRHHRYFHLRYEGQKQRSQKQVNQGEFAGILIREEFDPDTVLILDWVVPLVNPELLDGIFTLTTYPTVALARQVSRFDPRRHVSLREFFRRRQRPWRNENPWILQDLGRLIESARVKRIGVWTGSTTNREDLILHLAQTNYLTRPHISEVLSRRFHFLATDFPGREVQFLAEGPAPIIQEKINEIPELVVREHLAKERNSLQELSPNAPHVKRLGLGEFVFEGAVLSDGTIGLGEKSLKHLEEIRKRGNGLVIPFNLIDFQGEPVTIRKTGEVVRLGKVLVSARTPSLREELKQLKKDRAEALLQGQATTAQRYQGEIERLMQSLDQNDKDLRTNGLVNLTKGITAHKIIAPDGRVLHATLRFLVVDTKIQERNWGQGVPYLWTPEIDTRQRAIFNPWILKSKIREINKKLRDESTKADQANVKGWGKIIRWIDYFMDRVAYRNILAEELLQQIFDDFQLRPRLFGPVEDSIEDYLRATKDQFLEHHPQLQHKDLFDRIVIDHFYDFLPRYFSVQSVILDYGGVLYQTAKAHLKKSFYDAFWKKGSFVEFEKLFEELQRVPQSFIEVSEGTMPLDNYVNDLNELFRKRTGVDEGGVSVQAFREAAQRDFQSDLVTPGAQQLIQEALQAGVKPVILSNQLGGIEDRKWIMKNLQRDFPGVFSDQDVFFSDELGHRKQEGEPGFGPVLKALGFPRDKIVFVDDQLPNVEAARKLGVQALVYNHANHAWLADALILDRAEVRSQSNQRRLRQIVTQEMEMRREHIPSNWKVKKIKDLFSPYAGLDENEILRMVRNGFNEGPNVWNADFELREAETNTLRLVVSQLIQAETPEIIVTTLGSGVYGKELIDTLKTILVELKSKKGRKKTRIVLRAVNSSVQSLLDLDKEMTKQLKALSKEFPSGVAVQYQGIYGNILDLHARSEFLMPSHIFFWRNTWIGEHWPVNTIKEKARLFWDQLRVPGALILWEREILEPDQSKQSLEIQSIKLTNHDLFPSGLAPRHELRTQEDLLKKLVKLGAEKKLNVHVQSFKKALVSGSLKELNREARKFKRAAHSEKIEDLIDHVLEREMAKVPLKRTLWRLRQNNLEDLAIILDRLAPMVLPYLDRSRHGNPVDHTFEVVDFITEIMIGEGASPSEIKRGMAAALFHDAGFAYALEGKLRKRDIDHAPAGPERERIRQRAIRSRKAHMRTGSALAQKILTLYNKRFGPTFNSTDIRKVKHVIFHHDDPSIQQYEAINDGRWLLAADDRLLMFHREADRVTMLTESDIELNLERDRKRGIPVDPKDLVLKFIERHREEKELYDEAFGKKESAKQFGFKGGLLYRTDTGFAIFNRLTAKLFKKYNIPSTSRPEVPSARMELRTPPHLRRSAPRAEARNQWKEEIERFTPEERAIFERAQKIRGLSIGIDVERTLTTEVIRPWESNLPQNDESIKERLVAPGMVPLVLGLLVHNQLKIITAMNQPSFGFWSEIVPFLAKLEMTGDVEIITREKIEETAKENLNFSKEGTPSEPIYRLSLKGTNRGRPLAQDELARPDSLINRRSDEPFWSALKLPSALGVDLLLEDRVTLPRLIEDLEMGKVILVPKYEFPAAEKLVTDRTAYQEAISHLSPALDALEQFAASRRAAKKVRVDEKIFSVRATRQLNGGGIKTLGELARRSPETIRERFGSLTFNEIRNVLEQHGLRLRGDVKGPRPEVRSSNVWLEQDAVQRIKKQYSREQIEKVVQQIISALEGVPQTLIQEHEFGSTAHFQNEMQNLSQGIEILKKWKWDNWNNNEIVEAYSLIRKALVFGSMRILENKGQRSEVSLAVKRLYSLAMGSAVLFEVESQERKAAVAIASLVGSHKFVDIQLLYHMRSLLSQVKVSDEEDLPPNRTDNYLFAEPHEGIQAVMQILRTHGLYSALSQFETIEGAIDIAARRAELRSAGQPNTSRYLSLSATRAGMRRQMPKKIAAGFRTSGVENATTSRSVQLKLTPEETLRSFSEIVKTHGGRGSRTHFPVRGTQGVSLSRLHPKAVAPSAGAAHLTQGQSSKGDNISQELIDNKLKSAGRAPSLLESQQGEGTLFISRSEVRALSIKQWESFFIGAYTHPQIRVVVYGDGVSDHPRIEELRALPQVMITSDDSQTAFRLRIPNRVSVFLSKGGFEGDPTDLFGDELKKGLKIVELGEAYEPIGLALLYVIADGQLTFINRRSIYLEDPQGAYLDQIENFFAQEAVAWSA